MTIAEEAQRYLAVVEVFRREGCEPHWRPEPQGVAHGDIDGSPGALLEPDDDE
jgi:hypothetical protein